MSLGLLIWSNYGSKTKSFSYFSLYVCNNFEDRVIRGGDGVRGGEQFIIFDLEEDVEVLEAEVLEDVDTF